MPDTTGTDPQGLTARERDVLDAMSRGLGNAAIATELRLSQRTVRNYVSRTYGKLGVDNRVQAVLWWTARTGGPAREQAS